MADFSMETNLEKLSTAQIMAQLEYTTRDYNKMSNTPSEVKVVIKSTERSGIVMSMSERFQKEAKKLAKFHMKEAIDELKGELNRRIY